MVLGSGWSILETGFSKMRISGPMFSSAWRIVRPGLGLPPKYFESLIGMRVGRAVRRGTPMSWELLTPTDNNVAPSPQELPRGASA